jgi:hypothetical protein
LSPRRILAHANLARRPRFLFALDTRPVLRAAGRRFAGGTATPDRDRLG